MSIPYEKAVGEDLNLGHGSVTVTMPAGGTATGSKIGTHTFLPWTFSVDDFGAVADGVTDDESLIEAAIAAALAAGGGTVLFGPGTYAFNQIAIPSGVRLIGAGVGVTTLKKLDNTAPMIVGSDTSNGNSNIEIAHFTIDGNRTTIEGSISGDGNAMGIRLDRWSYFYLHDLLIQNCGTDGIYYGVSANDRTHYNYMGLTERVRATNCRRNNMSVLTAIGCKWRDIEVDNATGTAPEAGIDIEPDTATARLEDLTFDDIRTHSNAGAGFEIFLSNVTTEITTIVCSRVYAYDNVARGIWVARIDDDCTGYGHIRLVDCAAIDNEGTGFVIQSKSMVGPRVTLERPYCKDNANGTVNDAGDTARAHIKLYAPGTAGTAQTPGGIDILDPSAHNLVSNDKAMVYIAGNVDCDDVNIRNLFYVNTIGSTVWSLGSNFIGIGIAGQQDRQFRRVSRAADITLEKSDHGTIFDNTGAAGTVVFTLPAAPARTAGVIRLTWRGTAAQQITITPASGEQIMGLTVAVDTSVDNGGIVGTQLVLENIAAGQWMVLSNSGFAP